MGAGEYGLTRGMCFVARRLEVVAVAGLLWTSWCVQGGADFFFLCVCVFSIFFSSNARPAASMRPPCLIYLSTSTLAIVSMVAGASRFQKGGAVAPWRMGYTIVHAGPRPDGSFSRQDASFNLGKIRVGLIGDPQRQSSRSIPRHMSGLFSFVGKELVEIKFLCMFPRPTDSCYCFLSSTL